MLMSPVGLRSEKGCSDDAWKKLKSTVVDVPGQRIEMYCVSCEVRTGFIYVTSCTRPRVAVALSGD
jgi:hypothetical protein